MACITALPHLNTQSGTRGGKKIKISPYSKQYLFHSCNCIFTERLQSAVINIAGNTVKCIIPQSASVTGKKKKKNTPIWINSKYFYYSRCVQAVRPGNVNFKMLHLFLKRATACACFAHICSKIKDIFIIVLVFLCFHSDHGQPPPDEPRVTDPQWHLSLQHPAGRELHPSLARRLQLHWLVPHKHPSRIRMCTYTVCYICSLLALCLLFACTLIANSSLPASVPVCVHVRVRVCLCVFFLKKKNV